MMAEHRVPYSSLDTPAVLADLERLEANIGEIPHMATDAKIRLRPHIKVHENVSVARMYLKAA